VTDSGVGISEEDLSNLFKPFFRSKEKLSLEHNKNGNGLGLHICQSIMKQLNGNIKVQSKLGKGSCFTVTFNTVRFEQPKQSDEMQVSSDILILFRGAQIMNKVEI